MFLHSRVYCLSTGTFLSIFRQQTELAVCKSLYTRLDSGLKLCMSSAKWQNIVFTVDFCKAS